MEGLGKGGLAVGKGFYLASVNRVDDAPRVLDEVGRTCLDEPLVMQYFPRARAYFDRTNAAGHALPIDDHLTWD